MTPVGFHILLSSLRAAAVNEAGRATGQSPL